MSIIGLIIILAGWIFLLLNVWKRDLKIKPLFVCLYCIGALLLVIDGFIFGLPTLAVLNTGCFITSGLVYLKLKKLI